MSNLIDANILFNEDQLLKVFLAFDMNQNGEICKKELSQILGGIKHEIIKDKVQEFDKDGEIEIDFQEFKQIIKSILCEIYK